MKFFWPDVDDTQSAHRACGSGAGAAFFIAVVTGLVAGLQASGKINIMPGIGVGAFVDAGLFLIIGIGLCFHSRIAAVSGVLLYFVERVYMIKTYGFRPGQFVLVIILALAFINGARGAFAWHEQRKIEKGEGATSLPATDEKTASKPRKNFVIAAILILVIAVGVIIAGFFLMTRGNKQGVSPADTIKKKAQELTQKAPPEGPTLKLKLKSGRSFEGVLVKKNEEGIWLYIHGTGEVFFSVNEIAESV